jgi:hypothetical protein
MAPDGLLPALNFADWLRLYRWPVKPMRLRRTRPDCRAHASLPSFSTSSRTGHEATVLAAATVSGGGTAQIVKAGLRELTMRLGGFDGDRQCLSSFLRRLSGGSRCSPNAAASVTLVGLAPGEYRLEVRVENRRGTASERVSFRLIG